MVVFGILQMPFSKPGIVVLDTEDTFNVAPFPRRQVTLTTTTTTTTTIITIIIVIIIIIIIVIVIIN